MHLMKLFSSVSQVHIEFQIFPLTHKLLNGICVFKISKKQSLLLIIVIVVIVAAIV